MCLNYSNSEIGLYNDCSTHHIHRFLVVSVSEESNMLVIMAKDMNVNVVLTYSKGTNSS